MNDVGRLTSNTRVQTVLVPALIYTKVLKNKKTYEKGRTNILKITKQTLRNNEHWKLHRI